MGPRNIAQQHIIRCTLLFSVQVLPKKHQHTRILFCQKKMSLQPMHFKSGTRKALFSVTQNKVNKDCWQGTR